MEHFYESIYGWFDFQGTYLHQIQRAPNKGALFVEVGCYLGKSTAFMGVEIINSGKQIDFYTIDNFQGESTEPLTNLELYRQFIRNITPIRDVVIPIVGRSDDASHLFVDKSVDFVFIDAAHTYNEVHNDILAWLPKVKSGGFIGGHDYDPAHDQVRAAVDDIFKGKTWVEWCSWMYRPSQ